MKPLKMGQSTDPRSKYWLSFATLAALLGLVVQADSTTFSVDATVEIVEPISITEKLSLDFGLIVPPLTGVEDFVIDPNSGAISVDESNGAQAVSGHQRAQFEIEGDNGRQYSLSVNSLGFCSDSALILDPDISDAVNAPRLLDETVFVGGTLEVGAAVGTGPQTCAYEVVANYP